MLNKRKVTWLSKLPTLICVVTLGLLVLSGCASSSASEKVELPNVVGEDGHSAAQEVRDAGFKNIEVQYGGLPSPVALPNSDQVGTGYDEYVVTAQDPAPGEYSDYRTVITLTMEYPEADNSSSTTSDKSNSTTSDGSTSASSSASSGYSTSTLSEWMVVSMTRQAGETFCTKFELHSVLGNPILTDLGDGTYGYTCDCDATFSDGTSVENARCSARIGGTDSDPKVLSFSIGDVSFLSVDE